MQIDGPRLLENNLDIVAARIAADIARQCAVTTTIAAIAAATVAATLAAAVSALGERTHVDKGQIRRAQHAVVRRHHLAGRLYMRGRGIFVPERLADRRRRIEVGLAVIAHHAGCDALRVRQIGLIEGEQGLFRQQAGNARVTAVARLRGGAGIGRQHAERITIEPGQGGSQSVTDLAAFAVKEVDRQGRVHRARQTRLARAGAEAGEKIEHSVSQTHINRCANNDRRAKFTRSTLIYHEGLTQITPKRFYHGKHAEESSKQI